MRFRIDLKIFLFLILFYFTRQIQTYAMIMIFAIIHELGHLISGLLLGMKPRKLELTPYGISVSFKLLPNDYNKKIGKGNLLEIKKIIVALAGPITNLIIIILALQANIGISAKTSNIFESLLVIYSNILLIIFNLLPIYPLDGGRILKSILHIIFGKSKAEKYINNISLVILIVVTIISSIAILVLKNISIFIIVVFLWLMFNREDLIYRRKNKIYNLIKNT